MKGKTVKFERKIAEKNYKEFHSFFAGELHHGSGRVGWRRACWLTYVPLSREDHQKPEVLAAIRDKLQPLEIKMKQNYIKGIGCLRALGGGCHFCAMPKLIIYYKVRTVDLKNEKDFEDYDEALTYYNKLKEASDKICLLEGIIADGEIITLKEGG